jgi:hypothetical protein
MVTKEFINNNILQLINGYRLKKEEKRNNGQNKEQMDEHRKRNSQSTKGAKNKTQNAPENNREPGHIAKKDEHSHIFRRGFLARKKPEGQEKNAENKQKILAKKNKC